MNETIRLIDLEDLAGRIAGNEYYASTVQGIYNEAKKIADSLINSRCRIRGRRLSALWWSWKIMQTGFVADADSPEDKKMVGIAIVFCTDVDCNHLLITCPVM